MNVSDQVKFLIKLYERLNNIELFQKQVMSLLKDEQIINDAVQIIILMYDIKQMYNLLDDSLITKRKKEYELEKRNARLVTETLAGLDSKKSKSFYSYDPCGSSNRRTIRGGC